MKAIARHCPGRRARLAVGACAAVVLLLIAAYAVELQWRYQWAATRLEEIEPRYARLAGLIESRDTLDAQLAAHRQALAELAYPADHSTEKVSADVQQRIRQFATSAGMKILNSQILPPRQHEGMETVPFNAALEGDGDQLRDFLIAVNAARPLIRIDSVSLQRFRPRDALSAKRYQIAFSVMRQLP